MLDDYIQIVLERFVILQIFDKNWHKIHFSVTSDQVSLFVDCKWVETSALFPRVPFNANGEILLGKKSNGETVAVGFFILLNASCMYMSIKLSMFVNH